MANNNNKKASSSARGKKSDFSVLYNDALIGLYQISINEMQIVECNSQTAKLFGYESKEQFIDKKTLKSLYLDSTQLLKDIVQLRETGKVSDQDAEFLRKDGTRFWGRYSLIFDEEGNFAHGTISDITLQRQSENALEESEQRFQTLVEGSLMGISILKDAEFIYMNSAQKQIFYPNTNIKKIRDLRIHPDDKLKFNQLCNAIEVMQPLDNSVEIRFFSSQVSKQRQEYKTVVIRSDNLVYEGEQATLLNMADVTNTKRLEQLALLRSKMSSLGHVSVGIAHEIRSPLTGINLLIESIRENFKDKDSAEDVVESLDQIKKASLKIEAVVKRVLDFSHPSDPQVKSRNINDAIEAAIKLSQTLLRKSKVILESELDQNLPRLYIDNHLIEQVFLNLINNSVVAMKKQISSKKIRVASSTLGNEVLITVSDSGPGIKETIRDKIFDPFFTTRHGGSGIGLSICQRIVTDHGGIIYVTTSEWDGAQINIRLPVEKRQFKR